MSNEAIQEVIVMSSHGDFSSYVASRENAMSIFKNFEQYLPENIRTICTALETKESVFVSSKLVQRAILEVIDLKAGSPAPACRRLFYGVEPKEGEDVRPEVHIAEAWITELSVWLMHNSLTRATVQKAYGSDFSKWKPELALTFLSPFVDRHAAKTICYPDYDADVDTAKEYFVIVNGRWKQDASEMGITKRIVRFVMEHLVDAGDTKIELVRLNSKFA